MTAVEPAIEIRRLVKTFVVHAHGGVELAVLRDLNLTVYPGECVALRAPSGAGKSTLLRTIYANYKPQAGTIRVRHADGNIDMVTAEPRHVLAVRRRTIGYVSQFLRAIPRVPTVEVVMEPLRALGVAAKPAAARARDLLMRLGIPERLWSLSPVTFSGGEQQRVNVARGFIAELPILLLDEPTASLDVASRDRVVALIREARERGGTIVGIFHDADVRDAVATRVVDLADLSAA